MNNPYVTGPTLPRDFCGVLWAHWAHIDRSIPGRERLCDGYSPDGVRATQEDHDRFIATTQPKTEQDVNAQHMAAMGLADQPLGQPYQQRSDEQIRTEGRCESAVDYGRCVGPEGHKGRHYRGSVRWSDEEALAPRNPEPEPLHEVFTTSCDDAKEGVFHEGHTYQVGEVEHYCAGLYDGVARNAPSNQRVDRESLVQVASEAVNEIVWGEKSPYIGMKPIQRRTVRPMAEAVVDAIMNRLGIENTNA